MNRFIYSCASLLMASCAISAYAASMPATNVLWSNTPAQVVPAENKNIKDGSFGSFNGPVSIWESESYPIGNGRMGAMILSAPEKERFALNESSLWSGGLNPSGNFPGFGPDSKSNEFGAYQPFGDLMVQFNGMEGATDFIRSLDLATGIHKVSFKNNQGAEFERISFASVPHQVIVIHYKAKQPGTINAEFAFQSQHKAALSSQGNTMYLKGKLANGMEYEGQAAIIAQGGKVTAKNSGLEVKGAQSCTIYLALETDYLMDFKKNWKGTSPSLKASSRIKAAQKAGVGLIRQKHLENHASLFNRVGLDLGTSSPEKIEQPTSARLESYKKDKNDPDLEETMFQYGRYLIMSSTRPGNLPANLQGIWNDNVRPPWSCDYHTNINFQMAYWAAETANLSECHRSMIDFIEAMSVPCAQVTQKEFKTPAGGPVRGWTVRTSQNPFGGNGCNWNIPGSAWYGLHAWEHYNFNRDKTYLATQAYPMMKEICHFWEDHLKPLGAGGKGFKSDGRELVDHPDLKDVKEGTLVAPDGWSPEHGPRHEDGCMHDQQLIRELFTNTITAANILGIDREWTKSLQQKLDRLADNKIGKEGNLQEWMIDRLAKTDHRHVSHLFAVYPGSQINKEKTPELAEAARKSLEWRGTAGDSRRSWAWPWRMALWARFHEGEKAHDMLKGLFEYNTLPNLLTSHPPMQMDGNFGITAGMIEMLMQSHDGGITLLPAPTKAWSKGKVSGLRARGNVTVSFSWDQGKVTNYTLTSPAPQPVTLRVNGEAKTIVPAKLKDSSPQKNIRGKK